MNDVILWWIGCVVMITLIIDLCLWLMGTKVPTISKALQSKLGGHGPAALFGFVIGGLFVHFTGWTP